VQPATGSRNPLPVLATGIGGLVVLAAALLPWHALSVQPSFLSGLSLSFTQDVTATQGVDGKVAVIGGLVLIVAAAVMWLSSSDRAVKAAGMVASVAAAVVAFVILADIIGGDAVFKSFFRSSVRDFAQKHTGGLVTPSDQQIDDFRNALGITLKLRTGIVIALVGDLAALAGGVLALTTHRRHLAAPPAAQGPA